MKVVWIGHFVPYPPRGGAPQRSFHLLREVARRGELHFVGVSLRGHQRRRRDVAEARRGLAEFCRSVTILPVRLRSSALGKAWSALRAMATGRSYNETWLDCRASREIVRRVLAHAAPDVVHVDSIMVADLLPSGCPAAAVLNHHNVESHMMERRAQGEEGWRGAFMAREARLLRELERSRAARFGRHVVVSDLDAARLRETAPAARCVTVPNGVDVDYFRPSDSPEEPATLVFCGRMNWYPNDVAMRRFVRELWPEIRRRNAEARLTVVGMNPTTGLLAAAAGDRGVRVVGFVEDVRPWIAAASVYVCPILDGGGTRLKLLDAMALGKAIVATPLAAEGLEVEDGREMVIREFGPPFVEAVVGLLSSPETRKPLGSAARRTAVARYAWRGLGERLVAAYEEVMEEARARNGRS